MGLTFSPCIIGPVIGFFFSEVVFDFANVQVHYTTAKSNVQKGSSFPTVIIWISPGSPLVVLVRLCLGT